MNWEAAKRRIIVPLVLLLSPSLWSGKALALDPKKAITQYVHDVWTMDDGLPQNTVLAITQTRDGYLWLGTWQGLVRFDGLRFTVFDSGNTRAIKSNYIMALHEDREGSLWFGTRGGGVNRLKDGEFASFTTEDGLLSNEVWGICEDREGSLWFATADGGLSRFKDGRFTGFTTNEGLAHNIVRSTYEGRAGGLWIATYGGLNWFKDGKFTTYTTKDGLAHDWVKSVYEDRAGNLWIGTYGGLNRFKAGMFTTYTTEDGLPHNWVQSIYEDRDGNLWFGTYGGLSRFRDGKFTNFGTKEGLSHSSVTAIYEDREGSLWVGTEGGGLDRFKDGKFTTYTTREGLPHDICTSIYEDRAGNLWMGTFGGLSRFKDGEFTSFIPKGDVSQVWVRSIYEDRAGNLWVGTYGGLKLFKDGEFTTYASWDGLSSDLVWSIYEDRAGNLWIGTEGGGLNRFEDGKFTAYMTREGGPHNFVRNIYEDRAGNLWVATEGGLKQFKDGEFISFTAKEGLSHDTVGMGPIYEDSDGVLWIGTRGAGLLRYKDGRFTTCTTNDGLFDNMVLSILEDGNDNLWLGGYKGISRVSKRELNDFAEGEIGSVASVSYGTADGLKSSEGNSGRPSAWKSRYGKLWFPTVKGLVMIDPDNMKMNTLPPPVVIEQVRIDQNPIDPRQRVELPPGKGEIEIHYTALSFLDPKKVYFKYKLDGYNQDWVDAGTRRVAYYTNIPPGAYRFHVIACNNDGMWNETGAAIEFQLQPHMYQTRWFYALCLLAIILMGVGLHRLRVRQLRVREKILSKLVEDRTRHLRAANQQLEQMAAYGEMVAGVAHEVRNPLFALETASYVIGERLNEQDGMQEQLVVVQSETERLTELMDNLLELAKPKSLQFVPTDAGALLKQAVAAYRAEHKVGFPQIVLGAVPGLPLIPIDRGRLVQVLVNLMENAAKHARGVTRVTVSVDQVTASQLRIRVRDDGAGIAAEDLPKIFDPFFTTRKDKGAGLGLAIVQQIIKGHGGRITVESQPEAGTVFTIHLPTKHTEVMKGGG